MGLLSQFSWTDYLLALPITLLALFALGILLIDLMLPAEMKWANAVTASLSAATAAETVFAFIEAHAHLERVLSAWDRMPDPVAVTGIERLDLLADFFRARPTVANVPVRLGKHDINEVAARSLLVEVQCVGGLCAGGPCRGGLVKIELSEEAGVVRWHTDWTVKPVEF